MKKIFVLLYLAFIASACELQTEDSSLKYFSRDYQNVSIKINQMSVLIDKSEQGYVDKQLKHLTSYLNASLQQMGYSQVWKASETIKNLRITPHGSRHRLRFDYESEGILLNQYELPLKKEFYFPLNISKRSLSQIRENYAHCITTHTESRIYTFDLNICQQDLLDNPYTWLKTEVDFSIKKEVNTSKPYPEYEKMLEDGGLDLVAIDLPSESNCVDMLEECQAQWNQRLQGILFKLEQSGIRGIRVKTQMFNEQIYIAEFSFSNSAHGAGTFTQIYSALSYYKDMDEETLEALSILYQRADAIDQIGHSNLGENIKNLFELIPLEADRYRFVSAHGCRSYSYVPRNYLMKLKEINNEPWSKYLDIISRADQDWSPSGDLTTLFYGKMTFEQVYTDQSIIIYGDEDNPSVQDEI